MVEKWHDINWNAILAGKGYASRYYLRAGLIRKDRLPDHVPAGHHPVTAVLESYDDLAWGIHVLREMHDDNGHDVAFVLKKAQSSNANGIRFLTGDEATAICSPTRVFVPGEGPAASKGQLWQVTATAISAIIAASTIAAWALAPRFRHTGVKSLTRLGWWRCASAVVACGPAAVVLSSAALPRQWRQSRLYRDVASGSGYLDPTPSASALAVQPPRPTEDLAAELQALLAPTAPGNNERKAVWVLQRHVESALIAGRKFHLRVLLLCLGDLKLYVNEDVRALLATEPYATGRQDGRALKAHITNMGVQKLMDSSGQYDETSQNLSLSDVTAHIGEVGLLERISDVLSLTIKGVRAAGRREFFALPNCWEMFGADFMVEATSHRVVLLEINASPSLSMYGNSDDVRARFLGADPLSNLPESAGWRFCPLDAAET